EVDNDSDGYVVDPIIRLQDIILQDDKQKFLTFLEEDDFPKILPPCITLQLIKFGGEECAEALLEDEIGYTIDIHDTLEDSFENWTPLHKASYYGYLAF
ncbi:ankyrin repeat and SOCS box protein 2, partial [Corchorus capsularis]